MRKNRDYWFVDMNLEVEVCQLYNDENTIVDELIGSPTNDIDYSLSICKYDDVSSHVLLATNVVSPRFEKQTTSIRSQLLCKMGYIEGGILKNR